MAANEQSEAPEMRWDRTFGRRPSRQSGREVHGKMTTRSVLSRANLGAVDPHEKMSSKNEDERRAVKMSFCWDQMSLDDVLGGEQ